MSDEQKVPDKSEDTELQALLDSALQEFDKTPKEEGKVENAPATEEVATQEEIPIPEDIWTKDFLKQATETFERNLHSLIENGTDSELGVAVQKMAESAINVITESEGDDTVKTDFRSAIEQAIKDLSTESKNLQAEGELNEEELAKILSQTSLEDMGGGILPLMKGMMQSLLSKELLYPSLKEIVDKYPAWLEGKKESLPPEDLERFTKQLELMQKVCTELESEKDDDTDEVKQTRFQTTLSLMQEMQNCGQLPEELVGEQPTFFQFDPDGNPILPTLPPGVEMPQNCCVM